MFSFRTTTNPSATTKCRCPLHLNPYKLWVMDLELLLSISLAVSQTRTVETVLKMIVAGLVDTAGVASANLAVGSWRHLFDVQDEQRVLGPYQLPPLGGERWPFPVRFHRLVSTERFFPAVSSGRSKDRLDRLDRRIDADRGFRGGYQVDSTSQLGPGRGHSRLCRPPVNFRRKSPWGAGCLRQSSH